MKLISYILLFAANIFMVFAQQDSLSPKWEKGLTWKVTSTTLSPNKSLAKKSIIAHDTTISQFLWEVVELKDSVVVLSVLPLNIKTSSASKDTIDDSVIREAFAKAKNSSTSLKYQAELNGNLKRIPTNEEDSLAINNVLQNEYFVNDSALRQIFYGNIAIADPADEMENEYTIEEESADIIYWTLLDYMGKIVETMHSPYGEPYTIDSIVDIKDYTKEKWDSYQKGLAEMAEKMEVSGSSIFKMENGNLVNHVELNMNLGNIMKELMNSLEGKGTKKSKKELKATKEDLEKLKMNIKIIGNYALNESNHFPTKFNTEVQSNVSTKSATVSFTAFNELIFE